MVPTVACGLCHTTDKQQMHSRRVNNWLWLWDRAGFVSEHHLGGPWQEDDGLLPHDAPVAVLHVVHLVEDDPRQLPQQLRTPAGTGRCVTYMAGLVDLCDATLHGDNAAAPTACAAAIRVRIALDLAEQTKLL